MGNKKGDYKYYTLISIILGLIIVAFALIFIFKEYFNEGELDWEVCRQSIVLIANMPHTEILGIPFSTKDSFPLKCKTEVINLDTSKPEAVYEMYSRAVAEGWWMFGEGKYEFAAGEWLKKKSYCMVFARVHYTEKAIKEYGKTFEDIRKSKDLEKKKNKLIAKRISDYNREFSGYYMTHKKPGSDKTYNDYLPLLTKDNADGPYLLVSSGIQPDRADRLLVYKINTAPGLAGTFLGGIITHSPAFVITGVGLILSPFSLGVTGVIATSVAVTYYVADATGYNYFGDKETREKAMKQKRIMIVHPTELKRVGCQEYLTIPA